MLIETRDIDGFQVEIHTDDDPENPRTSWDNAATMACWHRRYDLGDVQPSSDPLDYMVSLIKQFDGDIYDKLDRRREKDNFDESSFILKELEKHYFVLDLYLLDHSGISISTGNFLHIDPGGWDSGQVGFIYISKAKARKEWGRLTKKTVAHVYEYMEGEVETYDDYLTGNVYGFVLNRDDEFIDSCFGFFGDTEYMMSSHVVPTIQFILNKEREANQRSLLEHFEQIKAWVRNKVALDHRFPNPILEGM